MALKLDSPHGPMWAPIVEALVFLVVIGGLAWMAVTIWIAVIELVEAHAR